MRPELGRRCGGGVNRDRDVRRPFPTPNTSKTAALVASSTLNSRGQRSVAPRKENERTVDRSLYRLKFGALGY
jgi:hypothetical protein